MAEINDKINMQLATITLYDSKKSSAEAKA